MTEQERIEKLKDLFFDLELISVTIGETRDFFEFLYQETDDTNLTEEHLRYHYKRIGILANVMLDRLVNDNDKLKEFFERAHKVLYQD